MKRQSLTTAVVLSLCVASARGQTRPTTGPEIKPDVRAFELTAVAPPVPALKYRFQYSMAEQIPGNAAPLLMGASLMLPETVDAAAGKANDALEAGDEKTYLEAMDGPLGKELDGSTVWDELDPALRRTWSDFDPPYREKHELTLLPHLGPLRMEAWLIRMRAVRQMRQGKVAEALGTIRQGYVLADKVTDTVIVSALVSAGITRIASDAAARVMNRPECPNLYWALANVPSRYPVLRRAWDAEHEWVLLGRPALARVRDGDEPTPAQWRAIMVDGMETAYAEYGDNRRIAVRPHPDPFKDASPEVLAQARRDYVASHHVSEAEAAKADPAVVLGHFYFREWVVNQDEVAKLRGLPYPIVLERTLERADRVERLKKEQPTNPLLLLIPQMHKAVYSFARADRELAALTAVEALRSYAAGHEKRLPEKLEDVTETPVPVNPATGRAFEYRRTGGDTAVLSDTASESGLTFTVKIRR